MKHVFWSILLIFLVAACESDPAGKTGSRTQNGEGGDTGSDSQDGAGGDDDGGSADVNRPKVPMCRAICKDNFDCVEVGADKLHQAANYECRSGLCFYLGCISDENCKEENPAADYICTKSGECVSRCEEPADCVRLSLTSADDENNENNWACRDGGCHYLGCLHSGECAISQGPGAICADTFATGIKTCTTKCDGETGDVSLCVDDHDDPSLDADNFTCELDACLYQGCNNDEECGPGYQCAL